MLTPTCCHEANHGSLHQILHARTHEAQERLNKHPLLDGLTRPDYPLKSYWLLLSAYYHFYQIIEPLIERAADRLMSRFDYTPRRKHGWLHQDLVDNFHIDPDEAFWRPARKPSPLSIENPADLVGALYSIETPTLDGHYISRHIKAGLLGVTPEHGGRFFHGYGEQTSHRWNEFLNFAEQACPDSTQRERSAKTARDVLAEMTAALDDYSVRADSNPRPRT